MTASRARVSRWERVLSVIPIVSIGVLSGAPSLAQDPVAPPPQASEASATEGTEPVADAVPPEPGQTADPELGLDAILSRHLAARTTEESAAVKTVKASGTVGFQGMQLPMTMLFQRPRPFRVDIDLQGMKMVQAYDGETAWTISPFQGIVEPEALGPEAEEAVTVFSDFLWGLLDDAEEKGITLELVGIEKVDNDETYHLAAKLGSERVRQIYLGGEDFLEHRISFDTVFMGAPQTLVATLGDYRSVDGLVVPHRIVIAGAAMQIDMTLASVETGVEVDAATFEMPAPVEAPSEDATEDGAAGTGAEKEPPESADPPRDARNPGGVSRP